MDDRWRTTVSIPDDELMEHLDTLREDVDSDAAAVRRAVERSTRLEKLEAEVDDLQQRLNDEREAWANEREDLQHQVENLRQQLAAANRRREETGEIVEYVEDEQRWRRAGLLTRTKWWLFGQEDE